MRSNNKPIGDFIRLIDERNKGFKITNLVGLSISKQFIKSVANVIGTDMENYKIISKNQFACSTMQVRRDKKMPLALYTENEPAIISQAYPIFEILDTNTLLPEYLMMWFTRSEFDREACFHAVGGVRGSLEWEDFCGMKLPIPSIEKQQEIVKEYQTIQNRIALNKQLIDKLEETAQAIYKHWFVDFEFPDENGKPYKSNGGTMVWNEELNKEIPEGWKVVLIKDFCQDMKSGGTPSRTNISYWNKNDVPWLKTGEIKNNIILKTEEYISNEGLNNSSAKLLPINTVLMSMYGANAGEVGMLKIESTTNQACCGMICKNLLDASFLYYHLVVNQEFNHSQAIGGAQQNLSKDYIENIKILIPKNDSINIFEKFINTKENNSKSILHLNELEELILSKMTKARIEKEMV